MTAFADLDLAGLRLARTTAHAPAVERAVRAYSRLGEHGACWLALGAAGAAFDPARRSRWRRATRLVAVAYVANQALKLTVRRPRPRLSDLPPLTATRTQLSFPSAHAATSIAAARAFGGLLPAPLRLPALAMAWSRVYLGVHYPSDVLAGMALGAAVAR
ncbi:MAG TPA: phosphatase PAP2 family protein [Conexibacter sp.]|nr:phosphatase PAP2 family protein [Conexibacter sp.]